MRVGRFIGSAVSALRTRQHALRRVLGLLLVLTTVFSLLLRSDFARAAVERYGYDPLGRLIQRVEDGGRLTEYSYDAAGNLVSVATGTSAALAPSFSETTLGFARRGQTVGITINGQNLQAGSLSASDSGMDISNLRQSASQLRFDLTIGSQVPTGQHQITLVAAAGNSVANISIGPVLPTLTLEPSPLALPPDGVTRLVTIRLSHADLIAHSVNIASSASAKATVSPSMVTIAAGQTTAYASVTPKVAGFANLDLTSSTLASASVPMFITADFRGISTSHASLVGVVVGQAAPAPDRSTTGLFAAMPVGITVGPVLSGVSPSGVPVGQSLQFTISGQQIPVGATVSLQPATGIIVGPASVGADGASISASLTVSADAQAGARRIVVKDAAGKVIPFANPISQQFFVTTGQPRIDSIDPLFALPAQVLTLKVRGGNLQNAQLSIVPATDLAIEPGYTVSADGTELTARVQTMSAAARGSRTVVINTPSGSTGTEPNLSNQFQIVQEVRGNIGPIIAPAVGIQVGAASGSGSAQSVGPIASSIGVLVGAGIQSVSPTVGVIGTRLELVINGQGLQGVQSVSVANPDGLILGTPVINADGTRVSVQVDVATTALKSMRRIVVRTANGVVPFLNPESAAFKIVAPPPALISISPLVVKAGTTSTLTVLGTNLSDIQGIRFVPDNGLRVSGTISTVADGSSLSVPVVADATAPSGPRVMVVTTAGGETPLQADITNTVQVAKTTTPGFAYSQPVGIQVGSATPPPQSQSLGVVAPLVGVHVQATPQASSRTDLAAAPLVGVVVGTTIASVSPASPEGYLVGASGVLDIQGQGLQQLTSIQTKPASQISFGAISVNPQGTQAQVPVTIPANQSSGKFVLRMNFAPSVGVTSPAPTLNPLEVAIGVLPTDIYSVSPIVLERGKGYAFTVRGVGLKDVYQLQAEPADGLEFAFDGIPVQWSTDSFGEKLTVQVRVDPAASVGSRVIRFKVPGGLTSSIALPANTITVVSPQ